MGTEIIHLIGCNHGIQTLNEDGLFGDSVEVKEQKAHFNHLLARICQEGEIRFIGEEWGLHQMSIAQTLAKRRGIEWANINTSREDLDRMGIPHDYVQGPYNLTEKDRWSRLREEFMLERFTRNRGCSKNSAIIVGFHHLRPMEQLLVELESTVYMVDYRNFSWYRPNVFCDD